MFFLLHTSQKEDLRDYRWMLFITAWTGPSCISSQGHTKLFLSRWLSL